MALEAGTYISDLVVTNPVGSTDAVSTLDGHDRLIKSTIKNTFPNIDGAMTSTQAELNLLDGVTATTAELNILDGVTSTTAELNYNDITTIGTAEASKTVTTDASKDIIGLNSVTAATFVGDVTGNADTATTASAVDIDVINETHMDWPNAAGMTQVFCSPNQSTSSSTFVEVMPFEVYVPPGATTLNYYITFLTDNVLGTGHCRLNTSAQNGTTVTQTAANTKQVLSGSVSLAGVSGWDLFSCEAYETVGIYNVTFYHVTGTFV